MLRPLVLVLSLLASFSATASTLTTLNRGDLAGAWLIRDKGTEILRTYLFVLSGEIDNKGPEGLAHFVEHLAWDSVKGRNRAARAGHSNAFTTLEQMGYWISGEPADAESMLEDLMQALQPLQSSEEFAAGERDIIYREYDYRKSENWRAGAREGVLRRLHADDPRKKVVGGVLQSIGQYNLAEAKALHRTTHAPQNVVIVIRGNISKRRANKYLANLRGRSTHQGKTPPLGQQLAYTMAAVAREVETKSYAEAVRPELIYAKVVQLDEPLPIPQLIVESSLLRSLLLSRLKGGLAVPLRYDNFYTENFSLNIEAIDKQHLLLTFEASPDVGVMPETLLAAFENELSRSAELGVQPEVLTEIKRKRRQRRKAANPHAMQLDVLRLGLEFREIPITVRQQTRIEKKIEIDGLSRRLRALAGRGRIVAELVQ